MFEFQPLSADDLLALLTRALHDRERGLGAAKVSVDDGALRWIAKHAEGDARRALTALEVAVGSQASAGGARVTVEDAAESMQRKFIPYDAQGDMHYDLASAFIKSLRGSDPDAALYWLARMLEGGEDPRFIARRLAVSASEDVGNADVHAIVMAAAALQVVQLVGLPECRYALAQATAYIACAPKSNAVTLAIAAAQEDVRSQPALPVPQHLRDASYRGAEKLGRGAGYEYPHDHPDAFVAQDYLGAARRYYEPTRRGDEARLADRLDELRRRCAATDSDPAQSVKEEA